MIEFKLYHVKICIHFTFLAILAILCSIENTTNIFLGLFACIFHEFGHILMTEFAGVKIEKIFFYGAGIKISLSKRKILIFSKDLLILLGGSGINFLSFGLFLFLGEVKPTFVPFAMFNLIIGIFNLLPFRNFDGGKILQLIIDEKCIGSFKTDNYQFIRFLLIFLALIFFILIFMWNKTTNVTFLITICYFLFNEMIAE